MVELPQVQQAEVQSHRSDGPANARRDRNLQSTPKRLERSLCMAGRRTIHRRADGDRPRHSCGPTSERHVRSVCPLGLDPGRHLPADVSLSFADPTPVLVDWWTPLAPREDFLLAEREDYTAM